jgi:MFS family permease
MYFYIALTVPSLFMLPVWGAVSDNIGRRVPVIVASIANAARVAVFLLVVFFHWPMWVILVGNVIHGIGGSHTETVAYITNAYIADNATPRSRTLEMALVVLWSNAGTISGSLIAAYALKYVGYVDPLVGVCVLELVFVAYALCVIPQFGQRPYVDTNQGAPEDATHASFLLRMKKISIKSMYILLYPEKYRRELHILVSVLSIIGAAGAVGSKYYSVYTMNYPLCWRAVLLAIFGAVSLTIHGLVGAGASLLWKWLQLLSIPYTRMYTPTP